MKKWLLVILIIYILLLVSITAYLYKGATENDFSGPFAYSSSAYPMANNLLNWIVGLVFCASIILLLVSIISMITLRLKKNPKKWPKILLIYSLKFSVVSLIFWLISYCLAIYYFT